MQGDVKQGITKMELYEHIDRILQGKEVRSFGGCYKTLGGSQSINIEFGPCRGQDDDSAKDELRKYLDDRLEGKTVTSLDVDFGIAEEPTFGPSGKQLPWYHGVHTGFGTITLITQENP